ncbi:hypothetical protein NDU88_004438 [Pleurodeles waltl]|uniref:Uncharacterized protein n=1 Tax=Pleurodeles waltl TaxID=8319 RepID=A0AAV7UGT3_PLEWA|nr:hypothetical protein NDU88_004438 [Pleurodeles waltl]
MLPEGPALWRDPSSSFLWLSQGLGKMETSTVFCVCDCLTNENGHHCHDVHSPEQKRLFPQRYVDKTLGGPTGYAASTSEPDHVPEKETADSLMTRTFLEFLFFSLPCNLQAVKKDLSADLQDIRRNLDYVSEKVSALRRRQG